MRIKSIRAVTVDVPPLEGLQGKARRDAWPALTEVANPMSKFPKYKRDRGRWLPPFPHVFVQVTAEDGTWAWV